MGRMTTSMDPVRSRGLCLGKHLLHTSPASNASRRTRRRHPGRAVSVVTPFERAVQPCGWPSDRPARPCRGTKHSPSGPSRSAFLYMMFHVFGQHLDLGVVPPSFTTVGRGVNTTIISPFRAACRRHPARARPCASHPGPVWPACRCRPCPRRCRAWPAP